MALIDLMLWIALLSALATILILAFQIWDTKRYVDWREEFERNGGIQHSIADVLHGSQVVGQAHIRQWRDNR